MARLVICPACRRHLRESETACPFCAADVSTVPKRSPSTMVSGAGLSRAAIAAVVAAGLELTDCSGRVSVAEYGAPLYGCSPPCGVPVVFADAGTGGAVLHIDETGGVRGSGGAGSAAEAGSGRRSELSDASEAERDSRSGGSHSTNEAGARDAGHDD